MYKRQGNNNDWQPNGGITTSSTVTDTPTPYADGGNYAVLNPLVSLDFGTAGNGTLENANLTCTWTGANVRGTRLGTIGVNSGKWYYEVYWTDNSASTAGFGFIDKDGNLDDGRLAISSGGQYMCAIDIDNLLVWFGVDGVWTGDPNAGTGGTSIPDVGVRFPFVRDNSGNTGNDWIVDANFGQRPFAYTPPTGFLPLHTGNLPDSTIVDGSTKMGILTYSGTNGDRLIATGETGIDGEVNFTPDLVWNKSRNTNGYGALWDSVRGGTNALQTYSTTDELNSEGGDIDSFVEGGTNFGTGTINASWGNTSGSTYVSWQWKAGTAFSNDAGTNGATIASVGSVDQDAGFSIVTYTGTGANATVGHGLGVAPKMMIVKKRNGTTSWNVYHESTGNTGALYLELPNGFTADSSRWNNTSPTSSVFTIGSGSALSGSGDTFIAYCFAEVEGYSKFGSYTGNGSADGTFVYLGFKPAFVMFKRADGSFNWYLYDSQRDKYNLVNEVLQPNTSDSEATSGNNSLDFTSNGFKLRGSGGATNASGGTYIYMAFAENPFKNSWAR